MLSQISFCIQAGNGVIKAAALLFDRAIEHYGVEVTKFKPVGPAKGDGFKQAYIQPFGYTQVQVMDGRVFFI